MIIGNFSLDQDTGVYIGDPSLFLSCSQMEEFSFGDKSGADRVIRLKWRDESDEPKVVETPLLR